MATRRPSARKPFVSSIPLWMRTDQPRQQGMDYWKGPHSKIISATPGMEEYRQIHLAENNPGLWPAISGVETVIPAERRIDGVAEVTFTSVLSPLRGRKQTSLAYKDEANVFRRTLLYAGPPYSARWYDVAGPGEKVGARSLIYLRRREGVKTSAFRTFLTDELVPALVNTGALRELRTQVFLPWIERLSSEREASEGDAREVEEVAGDAGENLAVAEDDLGGVRQALGGDRAAPDELGPAADRAERRPELVGDVAEEAFAVLDLGLGALPGAHELADHERDRDVHRGAEDVVELDLEVEEWRDK